MYNHEHKTSLKEQLNNCYDFYCSLFSSKNRLDSSRIYILFMVDIPKFCKRQPIEVLMFGWVNALRFNLPTITIEKAVLNFMNHHKIDEELMNVGSALVTYNRMQKEYFELERNG